MKITPIEIRQKSFEKGFRGYEKEEVDAFLLFMSQEWEKLVEENKDYRRRLEIAEKEVQRLRDVENSLFKTLKNAEDTGASVIEQANKSAELHLKESQMKAEAVLNDARSRAKNVMEEAEEKAKDILDEMQSEVKNLAKEYAYLEDQKQNLLQAILGIVQETTERVDRVKSKSNKWEIEKRLKEIKAMTFERKSAEPVLYRREEIREEKPDQKPSQGESQSNANSNSNSANNSGSFFDSI